MSPPRGKHNTLTRQWLEAVLNAAYLRGLVAKWSYYSGLHGKFRITRHEIQLPAGKTLPQPLVIGFASDFHAGRTTHPPTFTTLVDAMIAQAPDVMLLGGDYVTGAAEHVKTFTQVLARCQPPLGKIAVLGNHDLWTDDEYIRKQLVAAGVRVLVNESVTLPPPFASVTICGIDDPWTGRADVPRTFAGAGPVKIFLTHSPDGLLLLGGEHFDLGFAGHTHGGQVALPNGTPIMSADGPLSRTYGRGRFDIPDNGPFIVSLGVGCSNAPIRINADPELIICTLR